MWLHSKWLVNKFILPGNMYTHTFVCLNVLIQKAFRYFIKQEYLYVCSTKQIYFKGIYILRKIFFVIHIVIAKFKIYKYYGLISSVSYWYINLKLLLINNFPRIIKNKILS